jgi:CheY-like chemotaxis protein
VERSAEGARVLLVEDEPSVRNIARRMLVSAGYEVVTADDGAEALKVCRREGDRLQVVLSDVVMPVMGGLELRRRLAQEMPGLEVILMSGYPDAIDGERAILTKPFDAGSLVGAIGTAVAKRRARS